MTIAIAIALGLAFILFGSVLVRGPSLADRVIALDAMLICGIGFLFVHAIHTGRGAYLQVAVLLTLVGFISTAVIGRFIEGRGE